MLTTQPNQYQLPYKSVAAALLFTVFLGPLGLLYATLWGGFMMTAIVLLLLSGKLFFIGLVVWVACSVWSVSAVEKYNKKIYQNAYQSRI